MERREKTTEIKATTKSGYTVPVDITVIQHSEEGWGSWLKIGEAYVRLEESVKDAGGAPALFISSGHFAQAKARLAEYIPAVKGMKKANIILVLEPEEYARVLAEIEAFEGPVREACRAAKKAREEKEASQVVGLFLVDGVYWGDFNIENIRYIAAFRRTEEGKLVQHEKIQDITRVDASHIKGSREVVADHAGYDVYQVSKNDADSLMSLHNTLAERREIEANELMIFSKDVIYSSAGNKMLHSIGAAFGENKIEVYTTRYASDMKRKGVEHTTTYDAKEELKALGFKWNADRRSWKYTQAIGEISQEFAGEAIAVIKKYDTKVWPGKLGMERCWECGTYFFPKRGDYYSGMPYCGC